MTPDGSVYDAIYLAVSERQEIPFADVKKELTHREVPDDYFWHAWDRAVSDAVSLYCQVTGTEPKEES
jgi:hypothetical protein